MFAYLGAPEHADTYRAIMLELARARERFIVHLRAEELSDRVEFDGDLVLLLSNLVRWGNLFTANPVAPRRLLAQVEGEDACTCHDCTLRSGSDSYRSRSVGCAWFSIGRPSRRRLFDNA